MPTPFDTVFPLRCARVHEVCGPSATAFAVVAAAGGTQPVIWIREAWRGEGLNPVALAEFFDPARLLVVQSRDVVDALAVAEEALRDGCVPMVVLEAGRALDLREGRRLQLAAKTGKSTGLCLIAEGAGSNAAETRWHAAPLHDSEREDSTLMRWEIIKNKTGTFGAWDVRWESQTHRLDVVSAARLGAGSTGAPG
ncbi:ImuA family protein [Rhodalgimonas zhirmunskyi]|uniref:Protein ImuA n=1 Tax=Rhodalgimonas zhirmunskyi TaxID=2964767 RepID=A0AAJ1UET1_9RHOB|nr:hypothetical protein [Rhodoalgimonas zhirmunskyi]MDQ2094946.1 hypothetical protein [Rhodoalgimonas zhirmunskyi]